MQDLDTTGPPDWASLLAAARKGEEAALNEVWARLRDYLLLTADDVGNDLQAKLDTSDIVQQSLMEAHVDFGSFKGQSEQEIRAWLARLLQHNLIDAGRRFRQTRRRDIEREHSFHDYEKSDQIPSSEGTASSLVRAREQDDQLMRAIAQLPERSQQILELRHRQGLSHAEISRELGMTEEAARKLWSRTVEELRQRLTPTDAKPQGRS